MTETTQFSCQIDTTNAAAKLDIEIWLDGEQVFQSDHVQGPVLVSHEFNDTDREHEIQFIMRNKTSDCTQVDAEGNIVADACLTINDFAFEEIKLGYTFLKHTRYHHDFNGTQARVDDDFYGVMGCNGTVVLKFSGPIYMWLLEHL